MTPPIKYISLEYSPTTGSVYTRGVFSELPGALSNVKTLRLMPDNTQNVVAVYENMDMSALPAFSNLFPKGD